MNYYCLDYFDQWQTIVGATLLQALHCKLLQSKCRFYPVFFFSLHVYQCGPEGQKPLKLINIYGPQLFPIIQVKCIIEMQKKKFFLILTSYLPPSKFQYITLLCEMELTRKFEFFPIFHYKTILFSSESEFSMKNVFF